jgi:glycosyltransferase involved in cell wall biosynthesis
MKLLIYSHFFAPSTGGVETIVMSLAQGLAALQSPAGDAQFEVTVATHTPPGTFDDSALPFQMTRQPSLGRLWGLVRACDVVHMAGPSLLPLMLARVAGKPVVLEHHGYQAICLNGILVQHPQGTLCPGHFQARRYVKCLRCQGADTSALRSCAKLISMFPRLWLARRAARNVAITNHVSARHQLPNSSSIYYGIEEASHEKVAGSNASEGSHHPLPICFAYVGRLVSEKGIRTLLEAVRMLATEAHSFRVRLIGDGPERNALEAIIARDRLGIKVTIEGFLTGSALSNALRDVHVIVMPSTWEETAGLAAIEQMMRGHLVIASRLGGLAEVVSDAGMLCEPGNAAALADCMRQVLQDPSLIQSFGIKARDRAIKFFRRDRMIAEHVSLYRNVAERTGYVRTTAPG